MVLMSMIHTTVTMSRISKGIRIICAYMHAACQKHVLKVLVDDRWRCVAYILSECHFLDYSRQSL